MKVASKTVTVGCTETRLSQRENRKDLKQPRKKMFSAKSEGSRTNTTGTA